MYYIYWFPSFKVTAGTFYIFLSLSFSLMNLLSSFQLLSHIHTGAKRNCHVLSLGEHWKNLNCHTTNGELGFGFLLNILFDSTVTPVNEPSTSGFKLCPEGPTQWEYALSSVICQRLTCSLNSQGYRLIFIRWLRYSLGIFTWEYGILLTHYVLLLQIKSI